ncbi:hypothetical protein N2152v2_006010 [Parachlorella kessleri]
MARTIHSSTDYAALQRCPVFPAAGGEAISLNSLWPAKPGNKCVVMFLTHFADLSSTEFAQKLLPVLPQLQGAGIGVMAVGLGEPQKARRFAQLVGFPEQLLYADPTGALHTALGFERGFLPDSSISAYAKLVAMLAGVGSRGTIQEVLRGYIGDRSSPPVFSGERNLFDVLGKGYQRPFELATLRLFNMQLVLSHWFELAPDDEQLLTLQGGCIAFYGQDVIFRHADSGILKYANVKELLEAVLPGQDRFGETQVLQTLL